MRTSRKKEPVQQRSRVHLLAPTREGSPPSRPAIRAREPTPCLPRRETSRQSTPQIFFCMRRTSEALILPATPLQEGASTVSSHHSGVLEMRSISWYPLNAGLPVRRGVQFWSQGVLELFCLSTRHLWAPMVAAVREIWPRKGKRQKLGLSSDGDGTHLRQTGLGLLGKGHHGSCLVRCINGPASWSLGM